MNEGFRSQCVPNYRVLTEDQIKEIHSATLEILETVGIRILDEQGLQLMKDAGCPVRKNHIIR